MVLYLFYHKRGLLGECFQANLVLYRCYNSFLTNVSYFYPFINNCAQMTIVIMFWIILTFGITCKLILLTLKGYKNTVICNHGLFLTIKKHDNPSCNL